MPGAPAYYAIEDKYLVTASQAGSREAFDELARRYRGATIVVAWKILGSREAAQDAAQEALLQAFRNLAQLKDPGRFGSWLCTIARNWSKHQKQRESRSHSVDEEQMDLLLTTHDPDRVINPVQAVIKQERNSAIRELIGGLPDGVQIVVQLYYAEQWDVARIAEFLSLTRTTVKWRLHSGRKQIARELMEQMADENSALPTGNEPYASRGERDHGKDQAQRDQANPPHSGRDRIACRG